MHDTTTTSDRAERLVRAADEIQRASVALGEAYGALTGVVAEYGHVAWERGRAPALDDVNAVASAQSIAEQIAGALVHAGLRPVLAQPRGPNVAPVVNLVASWRDRALRLEAAVSTERVAPTGPAAPDFAAFVSPGQRLVRPGDPIAPTARDSSSKVL